MDETGVNQNIAHLFYSVKVFSEQNSESLIKIPVSGLLCSLGGQLVEEICHSQVEDLGLLQIQQMACIRDDF